MDMNETIRLLPRTGILRSPAAIPRPLGLGRRRNHPPGLPGRPQCRLSVQPPPARLLRQPARPRLRYGDSGHERRRVPDELRHCLLRSLPLPLSSKPWRWAATSDPPASLSPDSSWPPFSDGPRYRNRKQQAMAKVLVQNIAAGRSALQETSEGRAIDERWRQEMIFEQSRAGVLREVTELVRNYGGSAVAGLTPRPVLTRH